MKIKRDKLFLLMGGFFALLFYFLPLLRAYQTLGLPWHDYGKLYYSAMNIFEHGTFYMPDSERTLMTTHFAPIFFIIAGIVKIYDSFIWYLFLHQASMALSVMVIFIYTRRIIGSSFAAALLAISFLTNPYAVTTGISTHYDLFGLLFLLLFALFLQAKNNLLSIVSLILVLITKEDYWFYALCVCWILFRKDNRNIIFISSGIALAYKIIVLVIIYPNIYPKIYSEINLVWSYAKNEKDIMLHFLKHPLIPLKALFSSSSLHFLGMGLFLVFCRPIKCIALLVPLILWTSATQIDRQVLGYYYSIPMLALMYILLPLCFIQISSWKFLIKIKDQIVYILLTLMVCISTYFFFFPPDRIYGAKKIYKLATTKITSKHREVRSAINKYCVDPELSVYAQFPLATYVPLRRNLYVSTSHYGRFLNNNIQPDIFVLDVGMWDHLASPQEALKYALKNGYRTVYKMETFHILYASPLIEENQ